MARKTHAGAPIKAMAIDAADRGKAAPARAPTDAPPETADRFEPPVAPRTADDKAVAQLPPPIWHRRYQFMKWTLIFCAVNVQAIIVYAMVKGVTENAILVQMGLGMLFTAAGIVGAYVFGAVWDDKSFREAIANIRTSGRSMPGSYSRWQR